MLVDSYGREVNYLRVSVTERCNFRCQYCMPEKPFSWVPKENLLSFEKMFEFIKVAIDKGINKIRITGGEPTLRGDLHVFIKMIHDYKPDIDLAMTTNGYLLPGMAQQLKDAGLKRINVSLDSLKPEVAHYIAKKNVLEEVQKGIQAALDVGLKVKINCVPMGGINDDELINILEFCKSKDMPIRFIEYMENSHADEIKKIPSEDILKKISKIHHFKEVEKHDPTSPAKYYALDDGYKFGIIEPYKHDFCENCNRIRLTAEGYLIPCLYFDEALSIKEAIENDDIEEATKIFKEVIKNKPEKNRWSDDEDGEVSSRAFYETGG